MTQAHPAVRRVCAVAYTHYRSDPRVRREAEALAQRGDTVTVLALREPGHRAVDVVDGVRVIGFRIGRHRGDGLLGYAAGYGRFFVRTAAHLTRRPRAYDLVHVHSLPEAMVFAATVPKLARRPVLLDVHDLSTEVFASRRGSAPALVRWAERLALAYADRVVTVHDDYARRVSERGVDPRNVAVVINTPDDRRFPLHRPRVIARPPVLIYHGTFVARYGLAETINAFGKVVECVPGATLHLVGDGDFRPEVVRLVGELDLDGCVELTPGSVTVDRIPAHIAAADIGIVPFRDDQFTRSVLPTKLLEYVRMGLPAIVSRNPVIEHYFSDDDVYFVKPGDADEIANAVFRILENPDEAVRRARSAQRFFLEHGWDVAKTRLGALVDEMLGR